MSATSRTSVSLSGSEKSGPNDGRRWLHAIPSSLRWDAAVGRQLAADHVLVASRFQPHQYQTVVPGEARGNRQSGDEAGLFPAPRRHVAAFVSPLVSTSDGGFCFLVETLPDIRGAKRDIQIETECAHAHTHSICRSLKGSDTAHSLQLSPWKQDWSELQRMEQQRVESCGATFT